MVRLQVSPEAVTRRTGRLTGTPLTLYSPVLKLLHGLEPPSVAGRVVEGQDDHVPRASQPRETAISYGGPTVRVSTHRHYFDNLRNAIRDLHVASRCKSWTVAERASDDLGTLVEGLERLRAW